jgi:hypothetical protein
VKKSIFALCALSVVAGSAVSGEDAERAVPTADAAVVIARAAAIARFGEETIRREEPLTAGLNEDNNWLVIGTMPQGSLGGVVEVEVARRDGPVLRMVHGQ